MWRYTAKRGAAVSLALTPLNYGAHPYHPIGMPGTTPIRENVAHELLIGVMLGLWKPVYSLPRIGQDSTL